MNCPIPKKHRDAFVAHMQAHDIDDLPDGAWLAVLTDAARAFMKDNNIRAEDDKCHDAALWYTFQGSTEVKQ